MKLTEREERVLRNHPNFTGVEFKAWFIKIIEFIKGLAGK